MIREYCESSFLLLTDEEVHELKCLFLVGVDDVLVHLALGRKDTTKYGISLSGVPKISCMTVMNIMFQLGYLCSYNSELEAEKGIYSIHFAPKRFTHSELPIMKFTLNYILGTCALVGANTESDGLERPTESIANNPRWSKYVEEGICLLKKYDLRRNNEC